MIIHDFIIFIAIYMHYARPAIFADQLMKVT